MQSNPGKKNPTLTYLSTSLPTPKPLPSLRLNLRSLIPRSARPPLDSIPRVLRRIIAASASHQAHTTSAPRTTRSASTNTTPRQPRKNAPPPLSLLLLIERRALRGAHLLREQVLLVAGWVGCGDGGGRGLGVDGAEREGGDAGRWRICWVGRRGWGEVLLWWRGVHGV